MSRGSFRKIVKGVVRGGGGGGGDKCPAPLNDPLMSVHPHTHTHTHTHLTSSSFSLQRFFAGILGRGEEYSL